jgi:hypothetical protein
MTTNPVNADFIDLSELSVFNLDGGKPPGLAPLPETQSKPSSTEPLTRDLADAFPSDDAPTRPKKRVKTTHRSNNVARYAATAVVGAVLGGVGTVMALAALPTGFFE